MMLLDLKVLINLLVSLNKDENAFNAHNVPNNLSLQTVGQNHLKRSIYKVFNISSKLFNTMMLNFKKKKIITFLVEVRHILFAPL